jgi:predicted nucleic acid-binding Zn ribbon protein
MMNERQLKWELDRERLRISEPFPPPETHPEKPIGDILADLLRKTEDAAEPLPAAVAERWPLVVGGQLAQHTQPSHLKASVLYVYADHPGWLAELKRLPKTKLLKKIASIPDIPAIKDVRFQLDPSIRAGRK